MTATTEDLLPVRTQTREPDSEQASTVHTVRTHRIFIRGLIIDGEVIEADPLRRLVPTWHVLFDAGTRAEPETR